YQAAVLGGHPHEKSVSPLAMAVVRLKRAYTLHDVPSEWNRTANVSERLRRVSITPECAKVGVLHRPTGTDHPMRLRSLPKVFHTCGKNCGKSTEIDGSREFFTETAPGAAGPAVKICAPLGLFFET